jgi:hypothetical protein
MITNTLAFALAISMIILGAMIILWPVIVAIRGTLKKGSDLSTRNPVEAATRGAEIKSI